MSRRKEALVGYTLAAYTLASFAHDVAAIAADFDALARAGDQELYFSNSKWQPDARRRPPGKKGRQHGRA